MLNFEPWDRMLHQYVDAQGRVNYQAWKLESVEELQHWLSELSKVNLQDYSDPNPRLALWLNLYNALVIAQVLKSYPIPSIRPQILGVPNWIAFFGFFLRPVFALGDRRYSLSDIENGVVRATFKDPRIHFALVCAAVGCPLLRNEAYQPEQVQTQLDEDATRFINNPAKVRFDAETETLYCSPIFKWYRQDFLNVASSTPTYIQTYLAPRILLTDSTRVRYLDYDWSLNQRMSS
ncbi:DUF547 domain-containing protein [Myxacorys almedinensis]|uniref:DUF547 domain-containing protein n=1 Tax=Myxacorys almedinensis A TaxID=2690445 RepID=A0A8J7Z059_9CYAN|nr:DUF547 domain-containing protein [Myxacorys almedinensis]NDJ17817.1 DUF547 domain-containing protein [Myxacorys almedinensis A]